jgi:hypothetical protein
MTGGRCTRAWLQQFVDPGAVAAQAEVARLQLQGLAHTEEGVEDDFLGHDAEVAARLAIVAHDIVAHDAQHARIGAHQAAERRDERGLARAVGSQQGEELARLHGKGDPIERVEASVALADVANLDGGCHP